MSIVTDSTPMEAPKDPDKDTVFAIYKLLGSKEQVDALRSKYLAGNFGYGHAKQALLELVLEKFKKEREAFDHFMSHTAELEKRLQECEAKAAVIADATLEKVRKKLGF